MFQPTTNLLPCGTPASTSASKHLYTLMRGPLYTDMRPDQRSLWLARFRQIQAMGFMLELGWTISHFFFFYFLRQEANRQRQKMNNIEDISHLVWQSW